MISNLDHLNLSVKNLEETAKWYQRIFGFEIVEKGLQKGVPWGVIKSGDAMLCIYQHPEYSFMAGDDLERRKTHGLSHFALKVTDLKEWKSVMERENIKVSYGGAIKWKNSTSWYVNDPTGYEIEVVFWHTGSPIFDVEDREVERNV